MPIERKLLDAMAKMLEITGHGVGRWVVIVTAGVFIANLFYLGSKPFAVGLFLSPWDKLAHLCAFAALTGLLWLGWLRNKPVWLIMVVALIGIADELHQHSLPGRSADPYDLLMDVVAALLVVSTLHAINRKLSQNAVRR